MISLKSIECNPGGCGVVFTIPKELNDITHEHLEECIKRGWEYREAVIETNDNILIVRCPNCSKEAMKIWH